MANSKDSCGCDESRRLREQINHLEDSNMKLYAGRDCPNCGVRVEMHTESDLVLIKQSVLDELTRIKETSIPVASAGEGRKLKQAIELARREGTIEGENEFARWIDRKGAIILDSGEDEKAVDALQRYRAYCRRGVQILFLKEDMKYLLKVIDNLKNFKLPISEGLDPTFYATLSYEGDLAIAQRIEEIRGRLG